MSNLKAKYWFKAYNTTTADCSRKIGLNHRKKIKVRLGHQKGE